ncbi:MAG: DUF4019 domain-containing protein [Limisphaerales bacterium]
MERNRPDNHQSAGHAGRITCRCAIPATFANKKSVTETVTFMLEKDGQWRAVGYFIN